MRVTASLWWDRHRGPEQVDELVDRGRAATIGNVRATTVKIMTDGCVENCSCSLLVPYDDPGAYPAGHRGLAFVGGEQLRDAVVALDAQGLQVHMHAIGDQAVSRRARRARGRAMCERSERRAGTTSRTCRSPHPDDVPRFGALGVIANIQPLWACNDPQMSELTLPRLGEERLHGSTRSAISRARARRSPPGATGQCDAEPLLEMEVAVTRVAPGARDAEPFLPAQRLSSRSVRRVHAWAPPS